MRGLAAVGDGSSGSKAGLESTRCARLKYLREPTESLHRRNRPRTCTEADMPMEPLEPADDQRTHPGADVTSAAQRLRAVRIDL